MAARQASRSAAFAADGWAAALGAGAGSVGWARAAEEDISPGSRLAANIMLSDLARRPLAELEYFMDSPPTNEPRGGRGHAAATR